MRALAAVIAWSVAACGLVAWGGGCGQRFGRVDVSPGEVPEGATLPDAAAVIEAFAPVRVEVHPLSRFEGAGAARRAVVHVQVLDGYGHDVKWPGLVRVEVVAGGGGESGGAGAVHSVDLTSGESNARAFDSISRCYVVRVPAPVGAQGSSGVTVRVRWLLLDTSGGAQMMEASGLIQSVK